MSGVTIYMEGGGPRSGGRASLRGGMNDFLKPLVDAARRRSIRWKLVCCGPREEAYRRFRSAIRDADPDEATVLLVDSESPVGELPRAHLHREDGWDLAFASDNAIHLMVQVMETWIVADAEAVAEYFGVSAKAAKLPVRQDLEQETKSKVLKALRTLAARARKGSYVKIQHGSALLRRIDSAKVRARCSHCDCMFKELGRIIKGTPSVGKGNNGGVANNHGQSWRNA